MKKMKKSFSYLVQAGCNEKCLFCLNPWRETGGMSTLHFPQQKKVVEKILALRPKMLVFSGGEPLLDPSFPELVVYARSIDASLPFSIQTNGTFLTQSIAEKLKQCSPLFLLISLHGPEEIHHKLTQSTMYQKAIEGIMHTCSAGIPVVVNIVVTKVNVASLPSFLRTLEELGISAVELSALYAGGSALAHPEIQPSKKELKSLLQELKNEHYCFPLVFHAFEKEVMEDTPFHTDSCGAGEAELAVFPNGDVTLCPAWDKSYGNLLHDAWDNIEENIAIGMRQEKSVFSSCHDCGGCALVKKKAGVV